VYPEAYICIKKKKKKETLKEDFQRVKANWDASKDFQKMKAQYDVLEEHFQKMKALNSVLEEADIVHYDALDKLGRAQYNAAGIEFRCVLNISPRKLKPLHDAFED